MSLNNEEMINTRHELHQNFELLGKSSADVAADLNTTENRIQDILNLENVAMEDPWILREYMNEQLNAAGKIPIEYSKLQGNYKNYFFLNSRIIKHQKISQ